MGKEELSGRGVWQDEGGAKAGAAERGFYEVFLQHLEGTELTIRPNPGEFRKIYVDVPLSQTELAEIYNPPKQITRHGIIPDYAIDNERLGRSLYVEVKRQDGWVEGKTRSAGRGNAHERACKYFTPGLLVILREEGKLGDGALPFWTVFHGDIMRDPCRVREITCWYADYSAHFFMWRDSADPSKLIAHFDERLRHLLA